MDRVRLTPGAEKDYRETLEWYREEDPAAGDRFEEALEATFVAILANPTLYPKLRGEVRYRIIEPFPISVVYRIIGDEIEVVAIAHAKRRQGYWRRRNGQP